MSKPDKLKKLRARKAVRPQESATQRLERLSGVSIQAGQTSRQRATESDTWAVARCLSRRCAVMGWPDDEEHRAKARDQKLATLHGRLYLAGLLPEDAYDGVECWLDLDRDYRRIVLGARIPTRTGKQPIDEPDPRALANAWMAAQGVIGRHAPELRRLFAWCLDADETVRPHSLTSADLNAVKIVAKALGRHFGTAV